MLKLNVNQEKQLNFEIQIGGVQTEQVKSHLRIVMDGVEYGFPAHVGSDSITVDLPPLRSIAARKLKEGEEVDVKLEIVADGNYLTPWSDTFVLSNPLIIEAKIVDDDFKPAPAFKTKLVSKGGSGEQSQGVMIEQVALDEEEEMREEAKKLKEAAKENLSEDEMTEKLVNKLAEKLGHMFDKSQSQSKQKVVKEEKKTEKVQEHKEAPKKITKNQVANITEEGVYEYMSRAGTKNPTVQKLLYEQAEVAAGSSKPVEVLRQVVKLLKK